MQGEASVLSSVSKSVAKTMAEQFAKNQAEGLHYASSDDIYEKYFFSLIAEANRSKKVSPIIRLFEYFFIWMQLFLAGYNDFIPQDGASSGYNTFLKIFYIGFIGKADDAIPFYILVSIIDLITVIIFFVSIIDFNMSHEYRKWILIVLRIWHGHLFGIFLIPNILMIMKGIAFLGLHNNASGYIIVIVTILCGSISIWHYIVILPFLSRSPYLTPSLVHAWNIKKNYKFLLISAVPMGVETFLNGQFKKWIEIIPHFLMMAIFIYLIYELCYLPFKGILFNALSFGCLNGVVVGSFISIFRSFSVKIENLIFYIIPVIVVIITTIITYFIIKSYVKKVRILLSYKSFNEEGVKPTEDMKKEHLDEMKIDNKKKAFTLVQIGFENMYDMFVDWSLLKYLFDKFPREDDLIVFMSWLVSLFPSEIQFLHKLITEGTKIVNISIDNRFLFFQIHRIHIFRQSSTSRETSNDFFKVKSITDQTINSFCKFWLNLAKPNFEFKTAVYKGLALQKQQADAAWSEALDKYPNNPRFAKEYAIYLLEVDCNFKEAIKQNQIATKLENGFRMHNDKTFRQFVLTYPNYLKKGIVDLHGNLKGPQIEKKKIDASMTSNSTTSSSNRSHSKSSISSDINSSNSEFSSSNQIDIQEGERFLPQMNLRLALQRVIKELRAGSMAKIIVSESLRAILTIIFILIVILISKPMFDSQVNLFDMLYEMNKVQHSMLLMSVQIPWFIHEKVNDGKQNFAKFFKEVGSIAKKIDGTSDYMKLINQIESKIDFSMTKRQILCDLALQTVNSLNNINNHFYKIDTEEEDGLKLLKTVLYEHQYDTYSCGYLRNKIVPILNNNAISFDYLIRTYALQLRIMTLDSDIDIKFWALNSTDFCELVMNQQYITSNLRYMTISLSKPLHRIYMASLGYTSQNLHRSIDHRTFLDIKEKRINDLNQTIFNILLHNNQFNNNISVKTIQNLFDNLEIDSKINKEIKNDLNMLKEMKHFKYITKFQNNQLCETNIKRNISLLDDNDGEDTGKVEQTTVIEEDEDFADIICDFIIAFSPFIIFIFMVPSIVFLGDALDYEMTYFSNILRSLPKADCRKTGERIKPVEYQETKSKKKKKKQSQPVADASNSSKTNFWIFDLASAIIIIVFIIIFAILAKQSKNKIDDCMQYYMLFIEQRNVLYNLNRDILTALLYSECHYLKNETFMGQAVYTNGMALLYQSLINMNYIKQINAFINTGDPLSGVDSSIMADSKINEIRFAPICSDKITSNIPIDNYKCASFDRVISYYIELLEACIQQFTSQTSLTFFTLSNSIAPYLTHMVDTRFGVGYEKISERFKEIVYQEIKTFKILLVVIPIVTVILTVLVYCIEMILLISVKNQFQVFKSLLLHINPITFVANNQLIAFVYGKNDKASRIVSASHAVFTTSPDAMISINTEGIIEYINPATSAIFGFTPEQLLGQNIDMVLNGDQKEITQLFNRMKLMQSGQSSLIYECDMKGTRDDGSDIYLKITLIGFSSDETKVVNNFGITCVDMTNDVKQKNAVNEAKNQSELLLLQILPKDIIMRLNRGDTDISFTVQSSTIAFIDIEKFSNYSASLSASEIMQNLGLVFTAYDQLLVKYNLIIKIKLIGDDYMLAAGLFNQDVEPSEHATQVVNFTLECLDALEELNEQLNALLQVRIGVNSGGPLIAGVLGTDKPLFDIIGDPINVASRLQSTDIPGFVQISQQTYEYVANNESFHIEQRGEVELKGKGKQMTYLVHPHEKEIENVEEDKEENTQQSMNIQEVSNEIFNNINNLCGLFG